MVIANLLLIKQRVCLSSPLSLPSLRLLLQYTAIPTSTLDTAVRSKSRRTVSVSIPYGELCCIPSGESALVALNKAILLTIISSYYNFVTFQVIY